jgi:hypothetical protein
MRVIRHALQIQDQEDVRHVSVYALFRRVVLSETAPNAFFYSYTTNFTKIEATPMRHDFLVDLFENT